MNVFCDLFDTSKSNTASTSYEIPTLTLEFLVKPHEDCPPFCYQEMVGKIWTKLCTFFSLFKSEQGRHPHVPHV
jgi:hypothetical protein